MLIILVFIIHYVFCDPLPTGGKLCNISSQCHGGICQINSTNVTVCVCYPEYGNPDCSYHRISRTEAGGLQLGLSFVLICGVGNFIIGRNDSGTFQLLLGILLIAALSFIVMLRCCGVSRDELISALKESMPFAVITPVILLVGPIWSIVDGIYILLGNYDDSNGYALY